MARMGFSPAPGVKRHAQLPDVSTPHELVDLVDAVCSETEAAAIAATVELLPSEDLRNSNNASKGTSLLVYTKLKEVQLNADLPACRIIYGCRGLPGGGGIINSRIYKNGVAIGDVQSHNSSTWGTRSEDFADFSSGDLIQIYCKVSHGDYTSEVKDMRFHYTNEITEIGGNTLLTSLPDDTDPTISITNQDP